MPPKFPSLIRKELLDDYTYLKTTENFNPTDSQHYGFMDFYISANKDYIYFVSPDLGGHHFRADIKSLLGGSHDPSNRWRTTVIMLLNELEIPLSKFK